MRTGWMASAPRLMAAAMMLGMFRYDSELAGSPMHTASSANCTRCTEQQFVEFQDLQVPMGFAVHDEQSGVGVSKGHLHMKALCIRYAVHSDRL